MPSSLILLVLVVFAAYVVQSALGFGATILAVALAAFLYPIERVLPVLITLDLVQCAYIASRYHGGIDWRLLLRRILPPLALGLPVGMALFRLGDDTLLRLVFGVFVFGLAALELAGLARRRAVSRPLRRLSAATLLVGGGVTHGLYGCGGPMVVYVAGREIPDKRTFRSTLSALWVLSNLVLVIGFAVGGDFGDETAWMIPVLLAPLALGVVAGEWVHGRVRATVFQALVFGALLVAGMLLAVTA